MANYTVNPLTGRPILINGPTYNRLFIEAYDFIDGRLVRRANAPPLPSIEVPQYLNTNTGRMVRYGTRTYFGLIYAGYEILEDYYLVHPRWDLQDEFVLDIILGYQRDQTDPRLYTLENYKEKLEEINIALCQTCLMPENPSELTDGQCKECNV